LEGKRQAFQVGVSANKTLSAKFKQQRGLKEVVLRLCLLEFILNSNYICSVVYVLAFQK
jgi:hypothetical protein